MLARLAFALRMRLAAALGEAELRLVPALCQPGRGFLDVGANEGVYSWVALRAGARVVAVEPNPVVAAELRRTFADRVEVLELALSDRDGKAHLHVPSVGGRPLTTRGSLDEGANPGLPADVIEVRCRRLDELGLAPIGMLKIDVEGNEARVLDGAAGLLARDRPVVLAEVEARHSASAFADVFGRLTAAGYEGCFLLDGRLRPLAAFEPDRHQRAENAKPPGGRRRGVYINNFLFVHAQDAAAQARLRRFQ